MVTLSRDDKLKLSAEPEYIYGFRHGLFIKFYEQSLWRFVHLVRQLKPMPEKVKGGGMVIYGGLPLTSFEILLAENKLPGVEPMEYGWRWPALDDGIAPNYEEWRNAALKAAEKIPAPVSGGRDILKEILDYDLAGSTPLKAMLAISDWREYLQTIDRAG